MFHERKLSVYILIGDGKKDTITAQEILNKVGIKYRFAYCGAMEGPLPQLVSGLNSFVGLEQISRLAKRAQNNSEIPSK